ncbi:MAG: Spy/CpxP family protein refolding chaperone [Bacteroidales bacterium]|nr:Spy/CpxP family protein refolding chaperone [Bacteroidales bacterium]
MKKLFLTTLIALFAVTFSTAQNQQGQPKAGQGQGQGQMMHKSGDCNHIPNLSADQLKKMEPLRLDFQKQKMEIYNQIKAKKAQLIIVSTGDKINKAEAFKLIDEIAVLRTSLEKARFEHQMAVRALLTPEQQVYYDMHHAKNGMGNGRRGHGNGYGQGQMNGNGCGQKSGNGNGQGLHHGPGTCIHGN